MEEIKGWVLNIAAVVVLMIVLDLLMPEGRIKKFTRLLTGFIVMFIMINPVLMIFGRGTEASWPGLINEAFFRDNQIREMSGNLKEEQSRQTLELYRSMLLADIKCRLESRSQIKSSEVDIVLNENTKSEKFGEIRKLYLSLKLRDNTGDYQAFLQSIKKELQEVFLLSESQIIIHVSEED